MALQRIAASRNLLSISRQSLFPSIGLCRSSSTFAQLQITPEEQLQQKDKAHQIAKDAGYPPALFADIPVAWGSQDAYQHVNNVAFIRYFETGRLKAFESIAGELSEQEFTDFYHGKGIGPILKSISAKYKRPGKKYGQSLYIADLIVTYPDTLTVAHKVILPKDAKDRFTLKAICISHRQGAITTESETVIVTYDYRKLKKADMPDSLLQAVKKKMV